MKLYGRIVIGLVLLDQLTKFCARSTFFETLEIFSFFSLRHVQNEGIAFSLPMNRALLIFLTLAVIVFLVWSLRHHTLKSHEIIPALLVLSGAIGNFIDRIVIGSVTDFISIWIFPIFNMADIFISIGVLLWIAVEFGYKKSTE